MREGAGTWGLGARVCSRQCSLAPAPGRRQRGTVEGDSGAGRAGVPVTPPNRWGGRGSTACSKAKLERWGVGSDRSAFTSGKAVTVLGVAGVLLDEDRPLGQCAHEAPG